MSATSSSGASSRCAMKSGSTVHFASNIIFGPMKAGCPRRAFMRSAPARAPRWRVGPMGYIVPLYHPLRLAEEIAIVDQMLGGRLELLSGLVPGINPDYFRPFGLDYAERKSPTLEFVGYLRARLSARSSRSRSTAKPSKPTPPSLRCRRCSGRIRRSG